MLYTLRAVDAWKENGNWIWNDSFILEQNVYLDSRCTSREILKALRKWGYLSKESKVRVVVRFEQGIIEIQTKNYCPILALIEEI